MAFFRVFWLAHVALVIGVAPASAVILDWVTVGDPGNSCDPQPFGACFGSVAEVYWISKYETTNAQYAEFLNAVAAADPNQLYYTSMGLAAGFGGIERSGTSGSYTYTTISGRENMPVGWVSWHDTLRFANWLHNGQPIGAQSSATTEDGAYTFTGLASVGPRNAGAKVFLTSEGEWFKAAYYDSAAASYFRFPTQSDSVPTCATPSGAPNTENCGNVIFDFTDVGSYTGSAGPYGTFDQAGNAYEWTEAIDSGGWPVLRGGDWNDPAQSSQKGQRGTTSFQSSSVGFRVATVQDPSLPCSDGLDNDGDNLIDLQDPACMDSSWPRENAQCQDGLNNDDDDGIDFDGGASIWGEPIATADPQCSSFWDNREAPNPPPTCGLGPELVLILPLLGVWRGRRRRRMNSAEITPV